MATPIFLPRSVLPPDYGDRLRAAGLNEGISFGGSEIDPRDELSAAQQAQLVALASNPATTASPILANQDYLRFLAQQQGGSLPGLPEARPFYRRVSDRRARVASPNSSGAFTRCPCESQ
jgi:hypothetical protein